MEFVNLLNTLRRRWLTGLIVFALVAGATTALSLRPTEASSAPAASPVAGKGWHQVLRVESPSGDAQAHFDAINTAGVLMGTWVAEANRKDTKVAALREAGLTPSDELTGAMAATGATNIVGFDLKVLGVDEPRSASILRAWTKVATDRIDAIQPRVDGRPIVQLVPFGPVDMQAPEAKAAAAPATTNQATRTIGWPLGLLLGLISGLVAMFVHDALDRRVTSPRQLRRAEGGPRALAGSDDIRRLRAAVLAGGEGVTAVVSPRDEAASLTTAVALARSFAAAGSRTLLVDAGTGARLGSATRLTDDVDLAQALVRDDALTVLSLEADDTLADAVAGPTLGRFLSTAPDSFDQVVIAGGALTSPVAATVAGQAGQTVLVVPAGIAEGAVTGALETLDEVQANVLGVSVADGR